MLNVSVVSPPFCYRVFHCMNIPAFYIHLPVDGHLNPFQFLADVNRAAMNNCVQVFVCLYAFISFYVALEVG